MQGLGQTVLAPYRQADGWPGIIHCGVWHPGVWGGLDLTTDYISPSISTFTTRSFGYMYIFLFIVFGELILSLDWSYFTYGMILSLTCWSMVEYTRTRMDCQGHIFHISQTIHEDILLSLTRLALYIVNILPENNHLHSQAYQDWVDVGWWVVVCIGDDFAKPFLVDYGVCGHPAS